VYHVSHLVTCEQKLRCVTLAERGLGNDYCSSVQWETTTGCHILNQIKRVQLNMTKEVHKGAGGQLCKPGYH
jgi:hypothetical protein